MDSYELPAEGDAPRTIPRIGRMVTIAASGRERWDVESDGIAGELVRDGDGLLYRDCFGATRAPERFILDRVI